jgi:hypothetical protein
MERELEKFDALFEETKHLQSIYRNKLAALSELKQSLLQKAFVGELMANNVVAFQKTAKQHGVDTTSPEFTAHMMAYGYHWHEGQRRNLSYGRVKAQKFLHLAESVANVDLGRQPIKDAAGPNDFQHMLRAEEWAKSQQYFEFTPKRTGNGYDFKKLSNYNKSINSALAAVKPYRDQLEKILGLMLPMNTQQAEVFATVHAAWNNLILNHAEVTDETIIYEARENWHQNKMDIPVERFQKAIRQIKSNGLIPDGKAKRVMGQENLF